ncbi:unnamed protein product, partial [marine sediment metagenome]
MAFDAYYCETGRAKPFPAFAQSATSAVFVLFAIFVSFVILLAF